MRNSIKQLIEARAFFAENPAGTIRVHPRGDWPREYTRAEWSQWFRDCLNAKINSHLPSYGKGRNWATHQWWAFWRDSRAIRQILTIRLRVYQLETRAARSRFSHLLAGYDD